jgi:hypothetical protein
MKTKFYIFIMIFSSFELFSQIQIDPISIFKMQLFLDSKNIIKNDSLYKAFSDVVDLKLDTLKIKGEYNLTKSALSPKYKFFQLKEHNYKKELNEKELQLYWIFGDKVCSIAINQETGKSYRLLGFNTNDFLSFLSDFRETYKEKQGEKLSVKQFLKNYAVSEIDFECLYKGLNNKEIDVKKYPCLVRSSDPIWIK